MIRVAGRYRNKTIELVDVLDIPENAEVEVEIHRTKIPAKTERDGWSVLGAERLEIEWDNPQDAVYDNWKQIYGV